MQVHFGLGTLQAEWTESVVALGTFDGVHLGHQHVIARAKSVADAEELPCIVVTFDRHPASILAPESVPPRISGLAENCDVFRSLGVSLVLVLAFDEAFSLQSAEQFLSSTLQGSLRAKRLVMGHDFAFGKGREGTSAWLSGRIVADVVAPFEMDGQRVSSSTVREAILAGRLEEVMQWQGRAFAIEGIVVRGQKLGRTLGYPTINLARSFDQVLPPDGIYAGRVGEYLAAISIGFRPTVDGDHRTIEAYLLNYEGPNLYGTSVRLEVHHRLRDEVRFDTLDALTDQMALDVRDVLARLGG